MEPEVVWTLLFAGATALAAVLVSPLITAWSVKRRIRAELVSANRQRWINRLRERISEFLAISTLLAQNTHSGSLGEDQRLVRCERLTLLLSEIELMINPTEEDHRELVRLLSQINDLAVETRGAIRGDAFRRLNSSVRDVSQGILKREWEVVKRGE